MWRCAPQAGPSRRAGAAQGQAEPTTRDTILPHSPAGKVPGAEGRGGWAHLHGVGQPGHRRDPGRAPSRSGPAARRRRGAGDGAVLCRRDAFGLSRSARPARHEFARRLPLPALREATREQIARILDAWSRALAQHGLDGGFLFGQLSIADCMYAPVVSRFETYGVEVPAPVRAYMDRMLALPAIDRMAPGGGRGSRRRAGQLQRLAFDARTGFLHPAARERVASRGGRIQDRGSFPISR